MNKIQEPGGAEVPDAEERGTWVNQARDEPLPASHDDEHGQSAVIRNEEHAETHAARQPGGPDQSSPAVQPAQPAAHEPDEAGPGKAVRDMMPGGAAPQGDVPDAPAVQVAATEGVHGGYVTAGDPAGNDGATNDSATDRDARDEEHAEKHADGQPGPVRLVSNAVPGKPDGEVDTRP